MPPTGSPAGVSRPLLAMRGISKRFGGTQALRGVDLEVAAGEALAVIGENGAGKSTLVKIVSGAEAPDEGTMWLGGEPYRPRGPQAARRAGVAMVYQELSLAPDLSVADNILLGREPARHGVLAGRRAAREVREVLDLLGHPELDPRRPVGELSNAGRQLVEIARGLASAARVMILDEPTSSLTACDADRLFAILGRLRSRGLAIIVISHFLDEVRRYADRCLVLRDGAAVGGGSLASLDDARIIELMVGRPLETLFPQVPHAIGPPLAEVRGLGPRALEVRAGEIVGLFGLVGSGRSRLVRRIAGFDGGPPVDTLWLGRPLPRGIRRRRRAGVALLSEDRKGEGLAQQLSVEDNLTLGHAGPVSRLGVVRHARRRRLTTEWIRRLDVRCPGPTAVVGELSGGNQQKVAFARILMQDARLLLLDEPTRGVDVRTKSELYRLIGEQAAAGKAVVFVSSQLQELLAVCDTLGVMSRGRLLDVRPAAAWTEQEVLATAMEAAAPP